MVSLRRVFSLCPLAIAVLALAMPARANADTYNIVDLNTDQGYHFAGMDDSGHVFLNNPAYSPSGIYLSYLDGSFTGSSSSAPSLTADNGTACIPTVPAGGSVIHGVCNNGGDAFTGRLSAGQMMPSIYVGPGFDMFPYGGAGLLYMNSLGDIVFDDTFSNQWYEAMPTPAPEPTSLLLLATGMLGLAAFRMRVSKSGPASATPIAE